MHMDNLPGTSAAPHFPSGWWLRSNGCISSEVTYSWTHLDYLDRDADCMCWLKKNLLVLNLTKVVIFKYTPACKLTGRRCWIQNFFDFFSTRYCYVRLLVCVGKLFARNAFLCICNGEAAFCTFLRLLELSFVFFPLHLPLSSFIFSFFSHSLPCDVF